MPPRSRAAADPKAPKLTGPIAVCVGGPLDGWVYYVSDLQARQRAALAMRPGEPFGYEPTDQTRPWALDRGVDCQVWRSTEPMGKRRAAARRR